MALMMIPGDILSRTRAFGAGAPDTGYYPVTINSFELHDPTRPTKLRMRVTFPSGWGYTDWVNRAFDETGQPPKDENGNSVALTENQVSGYVGGFKTLLFSAGIHEDQMRNGATDDWLIGKTVYAEWHSSKDLEAKYGKVERYITPEMYEKFQASNTLPAVASASSVSAGGSAGLAPRAAAAVAPVPTATVAPVPAAPAPTNGAGTGALPELPPPPGSAQSIVR